MIAEMRALGPAAQGSLPADIVQRLGIGINTAKSLLSGCAYAYGASGAQRG